MHRKTKQREAIREVFLEEKRPLHPAEVLEFAEKRSPGIGQATVYRNLKTLSAEGWLQTVELPGQPLHYEMAGPRHHHYFRCRRCERCFAVQGCPGGLEELLPAGFQLDGHELVLYGLCDRCG